MEPAPDTVEPGLDVQTLLWSYFVQRGRRAAPVVDNGRLEGIVSITDVRKAEQAGPTAGVTVASIMTRQPLATTSPDATVDEALKTLVERDVNQLLVTRDGQLAGMISREGIMRYFQALRARKG
jgi:CBS domain-containing protein